MSDKTFLEELHDMEADLGSVLATKTKPKLNKLKSDKKSKTNDLIS